MGIRFFNIDTKSIKLALRTQDPSLAKELKSQIQLEKIDTDSTYSVKCIHKIFFDDHHVWCMGTGEYIVTQWDIEDEMMCVDGIHASFMKGDVIQMAVNNSHHLIILLDNLGTLSFWDKETLIMIKSISNTGISDFVLNQETISFESIETSLIISALVNYGNSTLLQLTDLITRDILFQQKIPSNSRFIPTLSNYLEESQNELNSDSIYLLQENESDSANR